MKRPNLVNKKNWTPFNPIPKISPLPPPVKIIEPEIIIPLTKKDYIKKNSMLLNTMGLIIMLCIGYFLWNVYQERKLVSEYIIKANLNNNDHNPLI
jgi:hypothetical protein